MTSPETTTSALLQEFDRQVETLLQRRYPDAAGVSADELLKFVSPLRDRLASVPAEGAFPFVIVIKGNLVPADRALPLISVNGRNGYVDMDPVAPGDYQPVDGIDIPDGPAYLLTGVDTGRATLNVTPNEALECIRAANRSPLSIDEGIALVTHFPEVLSDKQSYNAFSMLGSRRDDRRVPAIWMSYGRPRLGWCWAGNPHSWLGSASCAGRVGASG